MNRELCSCFSELHGRGAHGQDVLVREENPKGGYVEGPLCSWTNGQVGKQMGKLVGGQMGRRVLRDW